MARESHGHHRHRGHAGVEMRELVNRAFELRPVVPLRHEDDLRVHHDARLGQALHDGQELAADPRLAEEAVAQRGVGGVHGDVEGGEPLRLDARELVLLEVGQGDVVSVEKREAKVVVLHVEALPHPARELVDEAEHALVPAGVDLARARRFQLEAKVRPRAPEDSAPLRAPALHGEPQLLVPGVKVKIDDVAEGCAIDGHDAVAGPEPGAGGRRSLLDSGHHYAGHGRSSAGGHARGSRGGPGRRDHARVG